MHRRTLLLGTLALGSPAITQERGLDFGQQSRERRVALVIGCAAYMHASKLENPVKDANAMADLLGKLGFEVVRLIDPGRAEIERGLQEFAGIARNARVRLVFYAGHGAEAAGENYLLPTDFSGKELDIGSVPLKLVLKRLDDSNDQCVNIVLLDACRNNPFVNTRNAGGGLAKVDPPRGTLVVYATAAETTAADSSEDGKNGLFTSALLKAIPQPGLPIEQVIKIAGREVDKASGGKQSPHSYGNLRGDFFFIPTANPNVPVAPISPVEPLPKPKPTKPVGPTEFPYLGEYLRSLVSIPSTKAKLSDERGRQNRDVEIQGFRIGRTHVTWAMWREYCEYEVVSMPKSPDFGIRDDHPVVNVSWYDLCGQNGDGGYCRWATEVSGTQFFLPSIDQWEHVARGGKTKNDGDFPWGKSFDRTRLWCSEREAGDARTTGSVTRQNRTDRNHPFEVRDIVGNAWQWCSDASGSSRHLRGGSWSESEGDVFKFGYSKLRSPDVRSYNFGFRLCSRS